MSTDTTGLLALPAELRARIFTHLLAARNVRYDKGDGFSDYAFQPAIFRVNKQIHREAIETFRHQNTFVTISTPWQQAEEHVAQTGQIPILILGRQARQFPHYQMMAEADVPEGGFYTSWFVICLEDLHGFCRMWHYSDLSHEGFNKHLQLTLKVQSLPAPSNPELPARLSRTAQAQLLEPFTMVKNMLRIVIEGPVEESVKEGFYRKYNEPYPSPEKCLDECDRLKEEGNKAMLQKNYIKAKQSYEQSFEAMHILISGRARQIWTDPYFDLLLGDGRFKNQHGIMVRMMLRIKLVANMIEVYLKLEQPEEAKYWGWRSINLMRENMGENADRPHFNFAAAGAWGKVYYRTGLACQLLGEDDDARQLFRIAADWLPNDQAVQAKRAETALRLG